MWGSNFPATTGTLPDLLARAREAFAELPASQQEALFSGTAMSLYPALNAHAPAE
jgi:predicted TIM-barrel fold metal-dependent hydrolase